MMGGMKWVLASIAAALIFTLSMGAFALVAFLAPPMPPIAFLSMVGAPISGLAAAHSFWSTAQRFRGAQD